MDFRAYLKKVDPNALAFTGNDARIDPTKAGYDTKQGSYLNTAENQRTVQAYISKLYNQFKNPSPTSLPPLPGYGGGGGGAATVYAPKLDIAAVNAQARKAAEKAVNPFYTKMLNNFLAEQAFKRKTQEAQYNTNVTNLEDELKQTLEGNEQTRGRTTEDVAQNIGEINTTADEFQTDTGQEFDQARLETARGASTGGLGQQQLEQATTQRNVQEKRQVAKFETAKTQQELFKGRTFEDLLKSDELKKVSTEKGKKQAKFDLDTYIKGQKFEEKNKRNELEESRLERVAREQANQAKLRFNKYLAGISNPAQYEAAVRTYGGSF